MAKIVGAESVSIPAFGTGVNSFQREICAKIMIEKIARWFYFQGLQAQKHAEE